jgi:hypothetical protein
MEIRELLHRLLYMALVEIRFQSQEGKPMVAFRLADLFHNVPLQLERASHGDGSYEEVLDYLRKRAKDQGAENWLTRRIEELDNRQEDQQD